MRAGFYAPMKPPDDPVPSGDRAMARAILAALSLAGVETTLASRFRSRDATGDPAVQAHLRTEAEAEVARLVPQGQSEGWRVWITYHNYYKAPDLIGPMVAAALDIPYVLIEATRARKRLEGPWAGFARAAEAATDAAAAVLHFTSHDAEALHAYRSEDQMILPFPAFLPLQELPAETTRTAGLLSVGMMRKGDKLASYEVIAQTLKRLHSKDWRLAIAGDGPMRSAVERLMALFGSRVEFLGNLSGDALQAAYGQAAVLFWPGVNEAFGMAYLEAQASGVAVVAQDRPGVRDVLAPGSFHPPVETGADGLAQRLDLLLSVPKLVKHLGQDARRHVAAHHLLETASARLNAVLEEVAA